MLQHGSWGTSVCYVLLQFLHISDQSTALSNFFNFCGQPWARLNSDQSIFRKSKYKRTFLIQILSLALLWTPLYYAGELDKVWNDHVINRLMWRAFIAKFSNDWSSLSLSVSSICFLFGRGLPYI